MKNKPLALLQLVAFILATAFGTFNAIRSWDNGVVFSILFGAMAITGIVMSVLSIRELITKE